MITDDVVGRAALGALMRCKPAAPMTVYDASPGPNERAHYARINHRHDGSGNPIFIAGVHTATEPRNCADPEFLWNMGTSIPERLGAAAVGSSPRAEYIAPAGGIAGRRRQSRPIGWRLHQSDLAALGGGSRKEIRRNFIGWQGLSDSA